MTTDFQTLLVQHGIDFTHKQEDTLNTWELTQYDLIVVQDSNSELSVYDSPDATEPTDCFWPEEALVWVKSLPPTETEEPMCGSCNGSGEGQYDGTRCWTCKGKGVIYSQEEI